MFYVVIFLVLLKPLDDMFWWCENIISGSIYVTEYNSFVLVVFVVIVIVVLVVPAAAITCPKLQIKHYKSYFLQVYI
jgi:hypothetical protein